MIHGSMTHGSMIHGSMIHGSMIHGSMIHGSIKHESINQGSVIHGSMIRGSTIPSTFQRRCHCHRNSVRHWLVQGLTVSLSLSSISVSGVGGVRPVCVKNQKNPKINKDKTAFGY